LVFRKFSKDTIRDPLFKWAVTDIEDLDAKEVPSDFISDTTAVLHELHEDFLGDLYSTDYALRPDGLFHVVGDTSVDLLTNPGEEFKVFV